MWIVKGVFLGAWLFAFGTITFLWLAVYRHMAPDTAVSIQVITSFTTQSPWWWASLIASFIVGCTLVRSWPGRSPIALWIFLIVTSLIPVGFLAFFYVISSRLKEVAGKP
jgi:hypothetical protein